VADPALSDSELARQVAAHDRAAFLALYDRCAGRVYGLCLRMLQEPAAAEEVSQETFLKLWARADQFDPARGALVSWLLTIARRSALDRIRREARRPALLEPRDSDERLSRLPDPASQSEEARWRTLRLALQQLPREQRAAIELAYYQGLSHREISDYLGIPLGTVKTRIRLGMQRLRALWLQPELPPEGRSIPRPVDV
jgi:RNA polymerase sigma-70 factor (ECF subfamily)